MAERRPDEIVADLRARGFERAKVGGFDIDGVLRGKYMSLDKLEGALSSGFGFCDVIFGWDIADALYDQPSVTGWGRGFPDATAVLDPATLRSLPWEPKTAAMLADFRDDAGAPHPACPRSLLRTVRERARHMGFESRCACELEFFVFRETPASLRAKGFRGLEPLSEGMFGYSWLRSGQSRALMAAIADDLAAFEVPIEGLHTETGPGVYEVAIAHDELLSAADKAALSKVAMKQIAHEQGLSVTFMAKHDARLPGSSGHLHQSLWRDGQSAFFDRAAPGTMSETMRHYLGGVCALMPALTAIISPTINSYKRYVPGVWAPLTVSWGVENRTAAVRVIGLDSPKACRLELRQPAADLNPYLALAVSLAAGLHGISERIEPPPAVTGDASTEGTALPRTLAEATELLDASTTVRELLGDGFVDHFVFTRRWEISEQRRAVTDWELARYFESV